MTTKNKVWQRIEERRLTNDALMKHLCGLSGHIGHREEWMWNRGWFCYSPEEYAQVWFHVTPTDSEIKVAQKDIKKIKTNSKSRIRASKRKENPTGG